MIRWAYVNGRYLPHRHARVHIEDRGFQLADGVYEVIAVHQRRLVDKSAHIERLNYSLSQLQITWPASPRVVELIIDEVARRNRLDYGWVYLQITRGSAPRDLAFPKSVAPSLVITAGRHPPGEYFARHRTAGVKVITIEDIRWKRRDIKSVSLLAQVLGKQQAVEAGAFEAWMLDQDDMITEGCTSNAWIVDQQGELITHPASHKILKGVTRDSLLELAQRAGLRLKVRPFSRKEALGAREAMITSSRIFLLPVTHIDTHPVSAYAMDAHATSAHAVESHAVGDGKPGPVFQQLYQLYLEHVQSL